MKKILILGAGFGGLETASGLGATLGGAYDITLVDKSDSFFIGFSKIDVLFGRRTEEQARYPYARLKLPHVRFVQAAVTSIDTASRRVTTSGGDFDYDYLVIALGADVDHDATPGYRDSGAHEFYTMAGARRLGPVVNIFTQGTLVLGILGAPYKCPPAPYEVICQLHELFTKKGVRERITMKMMIPTPKPVPSPGVSAGLEKFLADRDIALSLATPITSIDAVNKQVMTSGGAVPYDLFIAVPAHVPPKVVREAKALGAGYVEVSPLNLETKVPNVYAVGDVSKVPVGELAVPKAGAFAEDAAKTVVSDILLKEGRVSERAKFNALGVCYFELGRGEVARVNANFLGGDKPSMILDGPSTEFIAPKAEFEASRRDRWFTGA